MLKLRLKRCGRKHHPSYRIVMINSTTRRDGYVIEELGFYDPISKKIRININSITTRLKQGAQPSETVKNLLLKAQIISIK